MKKLIACPSCGSMAPEHATSCMFCGTMLDPFADTDGPHHEGATDGTAGIASDATRATERGAPADHPVSGPVPEAMDAGDDRSIGSGSVEVGVVDSNPDTDGLSEASRTGSAGPSPWSRAGSAARSDDAGPTVPTTPTQAPTPGPATATPAPPRHETGAAAAPAQPLHETGATTDHPVAGDPPTTARRATGPPPTESHIAGPVVNARSRREPSGAVKVANRLVRTVVIALGAVVVTVIGLVAAGQFGAGPIGKQREAIAGRGDWVTYTDPGGAFSIQLPTEPTVNNRQTDFGAPWQSVKSRAGISEFEVSTVDYAQGMPGIHAQAWLDDQPSHFARQSGGKLSDTKNTVVQGNPGVQYSIENPDGWHIRGAIVVIGRRAYLFEVSARSDAPEGLERMLQTFTPLPAPG